MVVLLRRLCESDASFRSHGDRTIVWQCAIKHTCCFIVVSRILAWSGSSVETSCWGAEFSFLADVSELFRRALVVDNFCYHGLKVAVGTRENDLYF